jgi:UNC-50 family
MLTYSYYRYTSFYYRKQTKNQWARDDPAFAVTEAFFVAVSALAYAILFCPFNFWSYLWSVLYAVIFDWFLIGAIVATVGRYILLESYTLYSL